MQWEGRSLRVPSEHDMAAMACMHVFDHHGGEGKYLARHLADLAVLLVPGGVGWADVMARLPAGSGRSSVTASRRLLEGRAPGYRGWVWKMGERAEHWRGVLARQGGSVRELLRVLAPPRSFMARRYEVSPASGWVPFLYLWRPVRGMWRLVTGK